MAKHSEKSALPAPTPPGLVTGEVLRTSADDALLSGELRGIVATFHQNERPLGGLAGLLDWRLHGAISYHLREGSISGRPGELVYLPVTHHGLTYHVLLVGAGASESNGRRAAISAETLERIKSSVRALGIERVGISRSDLGDPSEESLRQQLKGTPLWIVN